MPHLDKRQNHYVLYLIFVLSAANLSKASSFPHTDHTMLLHGSPEGLYFENTNRKWML